MGKAKRGEKNIKTNSSLLFRKKEITTYIPSLKKKAFPFLIIILSSYPKVTWKQINSTLLLPPPKKIPFPMKSVKKITTIKKREKKERQRLIKNHLNLHASTIHRSFQTTLTGTKKNKRKLVEGTRKKKGRFSNTGGSSLKRNISMLIPTRALIPVIWNARQDLEELEASPRIG